ncbi:MAG: beta-lactamase domain-containing protein [Ignavibacteria bacterium]|nr:MAG: beta-lactamase domain-containing protein [Ignavibacteria bacterium]KAF0160691.1 MAG: beta-lactamase domain-containing protein [Ignavibacteria bacterium]
MKRKEFIKKSALAACASFLAPLFVSSNTEAKPLVKLNYKPEPETWNNDKLTLSWIGHSTVLINILGKWIITDPVLFERVGVYFLGGSLGPARLTPPALGYNEFPKPDIILLSHAHMDHMDYPSLKFFTEKYPNQIDVITAYLTKDVIEDLAWKSINVMDWNDEITLQDIRFRANEVKHFGWRFPWEKDRSRGFIKDGRSFNSYVIDHGGKKILFGGDTAMTNKFQNLKNENIDVAIMPIGAYNPWVRNHCNPEEAMKMSAEIGAKYFIPIHTKTFKQSNEPFNEAIDWMKRDAEKYEMQIGLEEIGQTFLLEP